MLMNSGLSSQNLKRRAAPRTLVKKATKKTKRGKQENQRAVLNEGAHTTLRCCVALLTGNAQKTGVLGARPVSRCRSKALLWPTIAYGAVLLSSNINRLISRHPLAPTSPRER
jgi:hypothetical protein